MTSVSAHNTVPFVDLSWQHDPLQADIIAAMAATLSRGDYVLGQAVSDFEVAFAEACGVAYGVGVGCGTDAIALGLRACGIQSGDEVILPVNTFVATLIGILQIGAKPVFVDCDLDTALIDLAAAEQAITDQTKAIIAVHLYGQMVSPIGLQAIAQRHDLIIFEDAAQAHLGEREDIKAGAIGAGAAFSFYPSKNLGALGDGGMVVTQQESVAQKVRSLRNYGSTRKYFHTDPGGTNSRLDTLQAAVLGLKLPHLSEWNRDRNRLAVYYDQALAPLAQQGIIPIKNVSGSGHVYHLYVVRTTADCRLDRATLQLELSHQNIQTGIHYPTPCHLQPAYQSLGYSAGDFPNAEILSQEILSLPMYPGLTTDQIDRVVGTIRSVLAPEAATV
ncbi:DegT/DnrJ/EryC1/StrS aminotransferase family protein [cf. Phormidesmis sp. LEGE 11477]|uniref:DegT/DnrJ/EryC1/StrS family aminotransferase n=1 Tax=cf. Phormidesmis sp. LEGE 11477 TaxID=1828680 RepID=UPI00187E8E4F|nr:DegT/DnrJ/EryC1/StrS family aminotransferase [cf. Phormidesmis sp. LEGE 11477]MBE9064460.1 DegT/DnrJ/EryC1/StrS family aminotransferase [cf. Phormidesmis sp. LEGE 11477]